MRKKLKESASVDDFNNEKRILSYLRHLEHPNILQLLGSYTHRKTHNLLFPLAGEDLEHFMTKEQKSQRFFSDRFFFLALCGIASAIQKVHTFMSEELDIKFIGCHYDLKPKNILVMDDALILADFGIARLKEETDDSKTVFKQGSGHYLAPECANVIDGFQRHSIGRSSDIWSFGCILVELLTSIDLGTGELEDFRSLRQSTDPVYGFTTKTFYLGYDLHPAVTPWLTKLGSGSAESKRSLVSLITKMLEPERDLRPKAEEVTARLCFMTLRIVYRSLQAAFEAFCASESHPEIMIETMRLRILGQVSGLTREAGYWTETTGIRSNSMFEAVLDKLQKLATELQTTIAIRADESASYPAFASLRILNDDLEQLFPTDLIKKMRSQLEHEILATDDRLRLEEMQKTLTNSSAYTGLGMLAAIKQMMKISQSEENSFPDLQIDLNAVEYTGRFDGHQMGLIQTGNDEPSATVLIEWIEYDAHWSEEKAGKLLLSRVGTIVKLHQSASLCVKTRTLRSPGYHHDPARHAFGIPYEIPKTVTETLWKPHTLRNIIEATKEDRLAQPGLGLRFSLAFSLATALAELHKADFLHKSVSSNNIIFFGPSATTTTIESPYIIGFNHSRPGDKTAFSEGPRQNTSDWLFRQEYQHPKYRSLPRGYRATYDYYSFGIVLLEIGMWRSVSTEMANLRKSPVEKKAWLLDARVPYLASYMGARYQQAVKYCLTAADDNVERTVGERSPAASKDVYLDFEKNVVEKIGFCSV